MCRPAMTRGIRSNLSGTARAAAVLVAGLWCGASASDVSAEAPPPKPRQSEEKAKEPPPSPKTAATLLVRIDEACELSVNGGTARKASAGETVRVPVQELGDQFLEAKTADGMVWSQVVNVREPGQKYVETGIAGLRTSREEELKQEEDRARLCVVRGALMWARRDNGSFVTWHNAEAYCGGLSLCGHDDWRLPTIQELKTLYDASATTRYQVVSGIALTGCCPWSSTMDGSLNAWFIDFSSNYGRRFSDNLDNGNYERALCVRSTGR